MEENQLVIYEQDKAVIDSQVATAKAYPRSIKKATEDAMIIVSMDDETAHSCTYSVPRGGKAITGPSVHLARILAQCWGNLRIEAKVIGTDNAYVISEAVCFDLESNIAVKTQVKRLILQNDRRNPGGKVRMNEDMITVTGNAASAIALRNAILNVIPKGVVNKIYTAAKNKITGDVSSETKLIAKRKKVVNTLIESYQVTEQEILAAIGRASVDHIDRDDIVVLVGIWQAIKDGDTTIDMAFRPKKGTEKPDLNKVNESKEHKRIMEHIKLSKYLDELEMVEAHLETQEQQAAYDARWNEIENQDLSQVQQNEEE